MMQDQFQTINCEQKFTTDFKILIFFFLLTNNYFFNSMLPLYADLLISALSLEIFSDIYKYNLTLTLNLTLNLTKLHQRSLFLLY